MTIDKFVKIFEDNGIEALIEDEKVVFTFDGCEVITSISEEWEKSINSFFKSKQFDFDIERRVLTAYRSVEFQIMRLDPSFSSRPAHEFRDEKNNKVIMSPATNDFVLSLLSSKSLNERFFKIVKTRIKNRYNRSGIRRNNRARIRFESLLIVPNTVRYVIPRKIKKETLQKRAKDKVKSSLFKLSYYHSECWELNETIKSKGNFLEVPEDEYNDSIPTANYDDDLVTYYKVAKSSQFPNQAFLSYYHVLEYYFLRVSDELAYSEVKSLINSISFNSSYENVNKIISIINKHDKTSDETEMLKAVLKKYVPEDELIDFLVSIEKEAKEKIYSDTKKIVLGEKSTIKLSKGHALSNTAKVMKHIRNALVHSSDKYNREDCFLPFSESEAVVIKYIPIVKFLAEKVIFATAK